MSEPEQIDYGTVRRYFSGAGAGSAAATSYMAHAQDLPEDAVRYRFKKERGTIRDWLNDVDPNAHVLDLGCGSGSWTAVFAERFKSVVGVEQSAPMLAAARVHLDGRSNVEFVSQDVRLPLPPGPYDLAFLGGLNLYLSDDDIIAVVRAVRDLLTPDGRVILRDSTVAEGYDCAQGEYQAIYRSVDVYRKLYQEAGFSGVEVRRNYGYTYMEMAVEMVEWRRRHLRMLPHTSPFLGALTWWFLRATSPASFGLFARAPAWLPMRWPKLQNHFFLLQNQSSTPSGN